MFESGTQVYFKNVDFMIFQVVSNQLSKNIKRTHKQTFKRWNNYIVYNHFSSVMIYHFSQV